MVLIKVTDALIDLIKNRMPEMELLEREEMRRHCSFKIGGPVRAMGIPGSIQELSLLLKLLSEASVEPLVIGNGTNLLVTDEPMDRFVIKLGEKFSDIEAPKGERVRALAGVTLARLASFCAGQGLGGLEFAHGIPGTLGGGVCMNAGAYGGELKDVVVRVDYMDSRGSMCSKSAEELDMDYRRSVFTGSDMTVVACELLLHRADPETIKGRMRELSEKRRASQPLEMPSAGSTFKRPVGGYAAALIDQAGLKGYAVGGARVSEKHAGFVINGGGASFGDVITLMDHISGTVYKNTGITLEPEVKIIT